MHFHQQNSTKLWSRVQKKRCFHNICKNKCDIIVSALYIFDVLCSLTSASASLFPPRAAKPNGVLLQIRLLADVATVGTAGFKQMLREAVARALGIDVKRVAINAVISASSTTPAGAALIELAAAVGAGLAATAGTGLEAEAGAGTGASSQVAIVIIDASPIDTTRPSMQLAQTLIAFAASASSPFATDMVSVTGVRIDAQFSSPAPQVCRN